MFDFMIRQLRGSDDMPQETKPKAGCSNCTETPCIDGRIFTAFCADCRREGKQTHYVRVDPIYTNESVKNINVKIGGKIQVANDNVNHPSHYTTGGIECIEAIEAAMTLDEFVAFCRGNAIKYSWRAGKKNDTVEDLRKAVWYLNRAADTIEKFREKTFTLDGPTVMIP